MMTKEQVEAVLRDEDCLGWGSNEVGLARTCLALYEREERLRKALETLVKYLDYYSPSLNVIEVETKDIQAARAALKETAP